MATETTTAKDITDTPDGDPFQNVPYGIGVPTEEDLTESLGKTVALEGALDRLLGTLNKQIADKRAELDLEVEASVSHLNGVANAHARQIVKQSAAVKADRDHREFAANLRKSSEETRTEMLRQLAAINQRAEVFQQLFPSPTAMLTVAGLGSNERASYQAQIANAGPAALGTLAKVAVARGDAILASAVMARLDAMPKDAKPFNAATLAQNVMGTRHAAMQKAVRTVTAAYQRLVNQNRAFVTGKTDLTSKIADGLRMQALNK